MVECAMQTNEIAKGNWYELYSYLRCCNFKHISLDFWNTIAFSNPKFKTERCNFIFHYFNGQFEKSLISDSFASIGKDYNSYTDAGGQPMPINELYLRVFMRMGNQGAIDLEEIKEGIFDLFIKYPPIISSGFLDFLDHVNVKMFSFSITSNTAFIPGYLIEKFLRNVMLYDRFKFFIFSDSLMSAKPDGKIFHAVIDQLTYSSTDKSQVIHVGDNYNSDFSGAKQFGIASFLINNNFSLLNERLALHAIDDPSSVPFSAIEYSRFKFGDGDIAKKYGVDLFEYFKKNYLQRLVSYYDEFYIFSSPYDQIPTASFYLTQSFYDSFKSYLLANNFTNKTVRISKIKRCQTYTDDYGEMNAEERFNLIKNDTYKLLEYPTSKDLCIFIDDISITGAHQRVVEKLISDCNIKTHSIFLYFGKLNNSDIDPSFENQLNYSFVNNYLRLLDVVISDSFKITTRTIKYILSLNQIKLELFIGQLIFSEKSDLLYEILDLSFANQYNQIELYQKNLNAIKLRLKSTKSHDSELDEN